jgi:epoxyqueuosine reductase QueG
MSPKIEWKEDPTEEDFPLIDRCAECGNVCAWQPRFEIVTRSDEHKALLASKRPVDYEFTGRPEPVICWECA